MWKRQTFLRTFIGGTTLAVFCFGISSQAEGLKSTTNKDELSFPRRSSIVGTWLATSNLGEGLSPVLAFATFHKGGTVVVSQNGLHENSAALDLICGCNAGNGHGVWRRTGPNTFRVKFTSFTYAGPNTADQTLNLTEPVREAGQHIGFGLFREGEVEVRGDTYKGSGIGAVVNLDGEDLNPDVPAVKQSFTAERMRIARDLD